MDRREFNLGLFATTGALAFRPFASVPQLRVKGPRIVEHLNTLAEFGKNPQGGVSRLAYSEADRRGREYVFGLMQQAKLDVSIDAAGNLLGRRAGSGDNRLKPLLFGSHVDS